MKAILASLLAVISPIAFADDEIYTVTASGPRTVRLAFKTAPDGKPYLPVKVSGRQVILFIDTGATTVLDLEFARSLGLEPRPSTYVAIGLTGVAGPRHIAEADFEFGKMKFSGMPVSCLDLSAMRRANDSHGLPAFVGQIGSDLLAKLRARIDYDELKLTVRLPKE